MNNKEKQLGKKLEYKLQSCHFFSFLVVVLREIDRFGTLNFGVFSNPVKKINGFFPRCVLVKLRREFIFATDKKTK